ncbi:MAG TPA: aminomethyl transferase family protein [Acidimicrobiia bacterium]|nr:aminomethyl transferase family protein [Acidimicrobiia bacterium]
MTQSLEDLLNSTTNLVEMLRNAQVGPNVYPGVLPEYTNWRDEQEAWQKTCILFDLSFHMVDLLLEGPGALDLLSSIGFNSFKGFGVDRAKHLAPCSHDGYVIGDVIVFGLTDRSFNLVGRAPALNWIRYHAETGGYDVNWEWDERTLLREDKSRRRSYRFQLQGPTALQIVEKVLGQSPPEVKFFHMTAFEIAGRSVRALRHGMVGQPGFELFGPWEEREPVLAALVEAGEEFGLRRSGSRAYSSNTLESGWIPSPLPAVYTGEAMKGYREWLPANGYEGSASIGGSFVSDDIEAYYFTPWDLGYGGFVRFDHDFIGRDALEEMSADPPRTKVTLALVNEDVLSAIGSQLEPGSRAKFMEFPSAVYAMHPYDAVRVGDETVGVSTWIGYSSNERKMLTLAVIDNAYADPGTEVTLLWGEESGGTAKTAVESHQQFEIRAIVSPVPFSAYARESYRAD